MGEADRRITRLAKGITFGPENWPPRVVGVSL